MTITKKIWFFIVFTLLSVIVVLFLAPIAQPMSFHRFANSGFVWWVPNFGNVISNLPFIVIGFYGMLVVGRSPTTRYIKVIYFFLFAGVMLTGLGSGYFHIKPNNETLVADRIPMTVVFMSLLSATIADLISRPLAVRLIFPLIVVGIFSVLWWHHTEVMQKGDLRFYLWVQFFPLLGIPVLLWLFYKPELIPTIRCLIWIIVWYIIAKSFELFDYQIYFAIGITGHTLKHLASAISTCYFVSLYRQSVTLSCLKDHCIILL
jgi:Ceramidase